MKLIHDFPKILLFILSFAIPFSALAECVSGNCDNGTGKYVFGDGASYEGAFKDSLRHGEGTYIWATKDKYVGNWEKGSQQGQGSYYLADGTLNYSGPWQAGQKVNAVDPNCKSGNCVDGIGSYAYNNGDKYDGSFKAGNRDGQGTYSWANSGKYVGNWEGGSQQGTGTYYLPDGTIDFQGQWDKGQKVMAADVKTEAVTKVASGCKLGTCQEGTGVYIYNNGDKYEGNFKGGNRSGIGIYTFADGSKYNGTWENGNQNGQGTLFLADGSVSFAGQWSNGQKVTAAGVETSVSANQKVETNAKQASTGCVSGDCQNGFGKYNYADIGTYEGRFANGVRNGPGTFTWNDGTKFVGNWVDDLQSGFGTLTFSDKRQFEGTYQDGVRISGTFVWADGSKYIGSFKNDKLGGWGTLILPDGGKYVGNFEADTRNGRGISYRADGSIEFSGNWKDGQKVTN